MENQKRGKNVAIAGAVFQSASTVVLLAIWLMTNSLTAMVCTLLLLGGIFVWLVTAILFYCRELQRKEALELEDIATTGTSAGTIFEEEQAAELRPAATRLAWMERWMIPAFTLLLIGYHAAVGILTLRYLAGRSTPQILNAAQGVLFAVLVAFVAFLFSRYAAGMSRRSEWRLLRAGGSYLLVSALFVVGVVAALGAAYHKNTRVDLIVAYIIPTIQVLLAFELVLNLILDLYRPRIPDQEQRPSFDSRLLNLVAEPGRVGHSIAETLNYQFGFEVSKTWFYQLLSRAFVPLIIFGALMLVGMTSIVIVREGEQYVVLHWGKADPHRAALGPGLHFKWPWPVDAAKRFEVGKVHEILLGAGRHRSKDERASEFIKGREVFLWTEEHGPREELDFLLAVPSKSEGSAASKDKPPPVNLIKLVASMQYLITDVYKYGYNYQDAKKLIECAAYREMVRYAASATLDSKAGGNTADRPEAIMTFGRQKAAENLKRRIQEILGENGLDLGVRVTYVGFLSVHPPSQAAPAYEEVLVAERLRDRDRYKAEGMANKVLATAAGDPTAALKLALAIRKLEELDSLRQVRSDPAKLAARVNQYISAGWEDIKTLKDEIEQERLLGRLSEERPTPKQQPLRKHDEIKQERLLDKLDEEMLTLKQQLLQEYQAYMILLESIRLQPLEFDYDVCIDDPDPNVGLRSNAEELLEKAMGRSAAIVAQAKAYRWNVAVSEQARAEAFDRELLPYKASPKIYTFDRWLDVWDEVLPNVTKYVLGVDRKFIEVWLNWERPPEGVESVTFGTEETK